MRTSPDDFETFSSKVYLMKNSNLSRVFNDYLRGLFYINDVFKIYDKSSEYLNIFEEMKKILSKMNRKISKKIYKFHFNKAMPNKNNQDRFFSSLEQFVQYNSGASVPEDDTKVVKEVLKKMIGTIK